MRNRSGKIGLTTRGGFAVLLWSLAAGAALLGATCDAQAIDLTQPGDTAGIKVDVPKDKVIVGGMQRLRLLLGGQAADGRIRQAASPRAGPGRENCQWRNRQPGGGQPNRCIAGRARGSSKVDRDHQDVCFGRTRRERYRNHGVRARPGKAARNGIQTVHLIGWDEPKVKCVLEKTVVGTDKPPHDEQLAAIRLVHHLRTAKDLVGRTPQEGQAEEDVYLSGPNGKKLTPEQLISRRAVVEKIAASQVFFSPFQGKLIDVIEVDGLSPRQNKAITYLVKSPGAVNSGSMRQRYASLTVDVPRCTGRPAGGLNRI